MKSGRSDKQTMWEESKRPMWLKGACKNWQNLLTGREMSGRVIMRYCKPLAILRYVVASSDGKGSPSISDKRSVEVMVLEDSLNFCILARRSKSWVNFFLSEGHICVEFLDFNTKKIMEWVEILNHKLLRKVLNWLIDGSRRGANDDYIVDINKVTSRLMYTRSNWICRHLYPLCREL